MVFGILQLVITGKEPNAAFVHVSGPILAKQYLFGRKLCLATLIS